MSSLHQRSGTEGPNHFSARNFAKSLQRVACDSDADSARLLQGAAVLLCLSSVFSAVLSLFASRQPMFNVEVHHSPQLLAAARPSGQKLENPSRAPIWAREKVGFVEKTAWRQIRNGGREVTLTSRLHRQKDKERQRKTEEKGDRRPVVAPGAGVRWRGSSTERRVPNWR